jgi:hypothetical protein
LISSCFAAATLSNSSLSSAVQTSQPSQSPSTPPSSYPPSHQINQQGGAHAATAESFLL